MDKKYDKEKQKKPRRGRNEGMVRYIESKKLYECRYSIGVDETGKTIYKSIYGKKKGELLAKMRDALAALGKGQYVDPSSKTLIAWCKEWYEVHKAPTIKINTKEKYLISIKRIEGSEIANLPLKNITQELLQKYYNNLITKYAEETVKATHSVINGAMEKAEQINMINKNVAKNVIIPKDDDFEDKEVKALNDEDYKRFMNEMADRSHYYMLALFMSNTGLRPGEAIGLNRSDIDIKNCTVRVNKTFVRKLNDNQKSTKTQSSKRTVPIPNDTIKLLKEYMLKQPNQNKEDPLFQTLNGTRLSPRNVFRQFKNVGKVIDCEWVNLHSMRHTYASRLFKEKIDIKIISKLLGHSKVSTTYDTYVHFIDNVVEDSVQVLNFGTPENLPEKIKQNKDNITKFKKAK